MSGFESLRAYVREGLVILAPGLTSRVLKSLGTASPLHFLFLLAIQSGSIVNWDHATLSRWYSGIETR